MPSGLLYREDRSIELAANELDLECASDSLDAISVSGHGCPYAAEQMSREVAAYRRHAYLLERFFGALLFAAATPLLLVLVLIVRMTSAGPGVFRQVRVGRHGRVFWMYKLRTMRLEENVAGPQWSRLVDPRITTVGRFLRATHLDELPQLWNVVEGSMALVGPRPERPELVDLLAQHIPGYRDRLAVQPGITGLAQVVMPREDTLEDVQKRLVADMAYVHKASIYLDLAIMLSTAMLPVGRISRSVVRSFGLDSLLTSHSGSDTRCTAMDKDISVTSRKDAPVDQMSGHREEERLSLSADDGPSEMYMRGVAAFERDLPRLLQDYRRYFVIYYGEQRFGPSLSYDVLEEECNRANVPVFERVVRFIGDPEEVRMIA
jgi:lipopolysaccharide/colanic/teichoic acid biosynthesis glycosyltransferase